MTVTKPKAAAKRKRAAAPTPTPEIAPACRVFGYCRVSTVAQSEEGESLDVQQRQIEGFAAMKGWTIEHVFVERGVSGSKPLDERHEGKVLLAGLTKGDIVITPKLDRMFRSALDSLGVLQAMKDDGVHLYMLDLGSDDVTGNGISKLVFTILSAVAEAERDRTRERITEVKRDQKQRGRFLGGTAPFGWRKGRDGALVPVARQQAAITRIQAMRAEGASLRDISEALRADGIKLSHVGVRNALADIRARAFVKSSSHGWGI